MTVEHSGPHKKPKISLVEVMVAVAIIGTAASLAVPRYMKDVEVERQSECPRELNKIVTAQQIFFKEHQRFSANLGDLQWKLPADALYLYGFRNGSIARSKQNPLSSADLPESSAGPQHYVVACVGNIDGDAELDSFTIDEAAKLVHIHNDRH